MTLLARAIQLVVCLAFLSAASTKIRPNDALRGLSARFGYAREVVVLSGAVQLAGVACLVAGFWWPWPGLVGALVLCASALVAVVSHVRAGDPPQEMALALVLWVLTGWLASAFWAAV
jgi:hypothetical protein